MNTPAPHRPSPRAPVVAFFPEASFGAALNCVGIAQALAARGARPLFICHPGFTGIFAGYGFAEVHLPGPAASSDYWQDFIDRHRPHFGLSPLDQLDTYVAPTWEAIVDTVIEAEEPLTQAIAQARPDLLVLDNVVMFPAVARAGCPWVRVVSCAETEVPDANVPPYLSGLSTEDRAACDRFAATYRRVTAPAHARYNAFRRARGLPPLPPGQFLEPSGALNLLLTPACVRHDRAVPLDPATWRYLEGCVRDEAAFDLPALTPPDAPVVYVSFGSLGATDTALMARMLPVFGRIAARFVVNVGPHLDAFSAVPDNVALGTWFPQPSVVARSDLFIHHGGNNSFCEALFHGVPSLVMPYAWDGHDNARRAGQTGTGAALHRSDWTDEGLRAAIETLLGDDAMRRRLRAGAARMQASPGTAAAAEAILSVLAPAPVAPVAPVAPIRG